MVGSNHTTCRSIFLKIPFAIFFLLIYLFIIFINYFSCNLLMTLSLNKKKRDIRSVNGLVLEILILSHMRNTDE